MRNQVLPSFGSVLEIVTCYGSNRYAEVTQTGLVDVDRNPLGELSDCRSWRYATDEERAEWEAHRLTLELTDIAASRGAAALAGLLDATSLGRDEQLLFVADELRARGLPGKASQVEAMRAVKQVRRATLVGIPAPTVGSAPTPTRSVPVPQSGSRYSFVTPRPRSFPPGSSVAHLVQTRVI